MTSNYWRQWDPEDLDSCSEEDADEYEDDPLFDPPESREQECSCGYYCMNCLGISWKDFM